MGNTRLVPRSGSFVSSSVLSGFRNGSILIYLFSFLTLYVHQPTTIARNPLFFRVLPLTYHPNLYVFVCTFLTFCVEGLWGWGVCHVTHFVVLLVFALSLSQTLGLFVTLLCLSQLLHFESATFYEFSHSEKVGLLFPFCLTFPLVYPPHAPSVPLSTSLPYTVPDAPGSPRCTLADVPRPRFSTRDS